MTAASAGRRARRRAKSGDSERSQMLVHAATYVAARAKADSTVTGATVVLRDGEIRYFSLADALAIVDQGRAAGSA